MEAVVVKLWGTFIISIAYWVAFCLPCSYVKPHHGQTSYADSHQWLWSMLFVPSVQSLQSMTPWCSSLPLASVSCCCLFPSAVASLCFWNILSFFRFVFSRSLPSCSFSCVYFWIKTCLICCVITQFSLVRIHLVLHVAIAKWALCQSCYYFSRIDVFKRRVKLFICPSFYLATCESYWSASLSRCCAQRI